MVLKISKRALGTPVLPAVGGEAGMKLSTLSPSLLFFRREEGNREESLLWSFSSFCAFYSLSFFLTRREWFGERKVGKKEKRER